MKYLLLFSKVHQSRLKKQKTGAKYETVRRWRPLSVEGSKQSAQESRGQARSPIDEYLAVQPFWLEVNHQGILQKKTRMAQHTAQVSLIPEDLERNTRR